MRIIKGIARSFVLLALAAYLSIMIGLAVFVAATMLSRLAHADPPLRVAVIDTGIDFGHPDLAGLECSPERSWDFVRNAPLAGDSGWHGTHVAGLIKRYAAGTKFCILAYRFFNDLETNKENFKNMALAIRRAIEDGAQVVNISAGGPVFNEAEYLAIAENPSVRFIVGAGNDGKDLSTPGYEYFPAMYDLPNLTAVGALNKAGTKRYVSSNYGRKVKRWQVGEGLMSTVPCPPNIIASGCYGEASGTSMATAVHTGRLIRSIAKRNQRAGLSTQSRGKHRSGSRTRY